MSMTPKIIILISLDSVLLWTLQPHFQVHYLIKREIGWQRSNL